MPKRSSIEADTERLAERLSNEEELPDDLRRLIAVALGRRGGLKGGKARAEKLSPKRRSQIAKQAAEARWNKAE
jgi:hypothetical protein